MQLQGFVLPLALAFITAVLEPDLDLGGCQFQQCCHLLALWSREVSLLLEPSLELVDLRLGKQNSRLPLLSLFEKITLAVRCIVG